MGKIYQANQEKIGANPAYFLGHHLDYPLKRRFYLQEAEKW